jgi:hypothetical protein
MGLQLAASQVLGSTGALADDWWKGVKFSGYAQAGITANPDDSDNGINFGHLFTDRANEALLNQFLFNLERPIDPSKQVFDLGFRLQAYYGSDARYTHFFGELDRAIDDRNQIDIVEAFVNMHLPVLTQGGVDVKIGQYVTLEGAEVIYAPGDYLYSHSYIFNFGMPFKHTGILTTTHLTPQVDIYLGVDTGVNTTFVEGEGDTNDSGAFHGATGLNLGKVSVFASTHIGPEAPLNNDDYRYLNDVVVTWKVTSKLTSITDMNFIRDDAFDAEGYGAAQYFIYAFTDRLSGVMRGEIWRDDDGAFVCAYPGNEDFVDFNYTIGGSPNVYCGGSTTYGAITVGLNYKPFTEKRLEGVLVRPEVRYDRSFDTKPFNDQTEDEQFTAGFDVIVPFSF